MRIKKQSVLFILAFVLLVSALLGIVQLISSTNLEKNIEQRALKEAKEHVEGSTADFVHNMSLQFDTLETFAKYLGSQESLESIDCAQLMQSFLTVNKFCTIAYTNANGDILRAVSADGDSPSGNISDRQYFKDAVYWKDARAIQYMKKTALTDDPRAMFAVPIVSKETIVGCLFASTEQDFFESKVFSRNDRDSIKVFLIDADGTIIADPANKGIFQNGYNVFESFLSETEVECLKQDFSLSHNGEITTEGKQTSYLAYCGTGFNGWHMLACIDKQMAIDKYSASINTIIKSISIISAIFIACMLVFCLIGLLFEKQKNKALKELEEIRRNLVNFMEKSGNASFYLDAKTVAFYPSKALEEMVGNELPKNWLSVTQDRKKLHPEFDYDGVVRVFNEVAARKEYREICTCIKKKGGDIRWLKISMTPSLDQRDNYSGVVGFVTDITDTYTNNAIRLEEQSDISKTLIAYIPLTVSVNLTHSTYSLINHDPNFCEDLPLNGTYDDLFAFGASRVPEEYSAMFLQMFNKDNLLSAYEQGSDDLECEHPVIVNSEKSVRWVIEKISFLPNKVNNDVRLLFTVVDITQRKEYESLLQQKYADTVELELTQEETDSTDNVSNTDVSETNPKVAIRAFGYFDLFVNGQAIAFANEKSKEMLALLVDRKGGFVSSSEMVSYLWEDEPYDKRTQTRCRQVASRLKKVLDDNGIGDIIETVNGKRRIIPDKVDCDFFKYLSDKNKYRNLYSGSYMMNYSWGEMTIAELENDMTV